MSMSNPTPATVPMPAELAELIRAALAAADDPPDPGQHPPAPCVLCNRPTPIRWRGRPRHAFAGCARPPAPEVAARLTAAGIDPPKRSQMAAERPAGPSGTDNTPDATNTDSSAARPAGSTATEASQPARNEVELRAFGRCVLKTMQADNKYLKAEDIDGDAVAAALDLWHEHTRGLRFFKPPKEEDDSETARDEESYAGQVGVARYARVRATDGYPGESGRSLLASALVHAINNQSDDEHPFAHDYSFLNQQLELTTDQAVTTLDVNVQYLAGSRCELGSGEPDHYDDVDQADDAMTKLPGYARAGRELPADKLGWRLGLARIRPGDWVPMPIVRYIQRDLRIPFPAVELLVWHRHGRALDAWGTPFRTLREALLGRTDTAARYAMKVNAMVYRSFLGGMLKSDQYNKYVRRPDWSHMVEATGWANAFRGVDKGSTTNNILGMRRDAVWFVADHAPYRPPGVIISMDDDGFKAGKFKIERHGPITDEIIRTQKRGRIGMVNDAIIATDKERKARGA